MASPEKQLVHFPERDRPVVTEVDLETNYELVKEMTYACFAQSFNGTSKNEIPCLSDFEAGYIIFSDIFYIYIYKVFCATAQQHQQRI